MIKKIGLGLLGFVALLTAVAFVLPRQVHVERSLEMNAAPQVVFEQVNTLRNWENWSPWHQIDPHMQLRYAGPAAGTGARYTWTSTHDQVGNGALTILNSTPYSQITSEMDFMENGKATGTYTFEQTPGGTKVTWAMDTDMGLNPIGRYFGLCMDNMIGADFEKGLQNMKALVEQPELPGATETASM